MKPTKACPVVLREQERGVEILAFRHPLAGSQLVKGTIEPTEVPALAALRELAEEAGITEARVVKELGLWDSGYQEQVWALVQVEPAASLPSSWVHHAEDDGGHNFAFFWHELHSEPGAEWHPLFAAALRYLREHHAVLGQPQLVGGTSVSPANAA